LTYVVLAIALYFKIDMIISENALNQDLIPKSNVGDSQRRSLQDLISDPVVDGGIDSGGNVPSD
jgi:hypothetical protein